MLQLDVIKVFTSPSPVPTANKPARMSVNQYIMKYVRKGVLRLHKQVREIETRK